MDASKYRVSSKAFSPNISTQLSYNNRRQPPHLHFVEGGSPASIASTVCEQYGHGGGGWMAVLTKRINIKVKPKNNKSTCLVC